MSQTRLTGLAMLSIGGEFAEKTELRHCHWRFYVSISVDVRWFVSLHFIWRFHNMLCGFAIPQRLC